MTLIHIWASSGPVDSGPYLGIIATWIFSYVPGPHVDLVTVVPPGPHLDLVALVPYWALLDLVPVVSIWPHMEHNDSDPYLGLSWTC